MELFGNEFDSVYAFYNIINTVELDPKNILYYAMIYIKFYFSTGIKSTQIIQETRSYFYCMHTNMGIYNNRALYSYMFLDIVYERIKVYKIILVFLGKKRPLINDHLKMLIDFFF